MPNFKIYCPPAAFDSAADWGFAEHKTQDSARIAAVPVLFNMKHDFSYRPEISVSDFDLVLLSDIEYRPIQEISAWANEHFGSKWLLAIGGLHPRETVDADRVIYRPWWAFNLMRMNTWQDVSSDHKPYLFDALLGARRPHRDFVMLACQQHRLLDRAVVNYRSVFQGEVIDSNSRTVAKQFPEQTLQWPCVSNNLDPSWEVTDNITYSISPYVPWEIYRRCWFTVICETLGIGDTFFFSEKTTKALFAKRLFVVFSTPGFLAQLRNQGFKTFDCVIDESYDSISDPIKRWHAAFQQVLALSTANLKEVIDRVQPILDHNRARLFELQEQKQNAMRQMVIDRIGCAE